MEIDIPPRYRALIAPTWILREMNAMLRRATWLVARVPGQGCVGAAEGSTDLAVARHELAGACRALRATLGNLRAPGESCPLLGKH